MIATLTLAMTLLTAAPQRGPAMNATTADVLKSLRREHPRLIGLPEDLARVKRLIAGDAKAAAVYRYVKRQADKLLDASPIEYKLIGPRLLDKSRTCLNRVYTLATVYRIDGDRRYADRAIREMLTAAAFRDWNPKHFLDTAEMTHALAIGYDWLFDVLSAGDRRTIRQAIVDKGLHEGEEVYRKGGWWAATEWNWNQVCNGGMTLGAWPSPKTSRSWPPSSSSTPWPRCRWPCGRTLPTGPGPKGPAIGTMPPATRSTCWPGWNRPWAPTSD